MEREVISPDVKHSHSNYLSAYATVYGDDDAVDPIAVFRTSRNVEKLEQAYRSPLALGHSAAYTLSY